MQILGAANQEFFSGTSMIIGLFVSLGAAFGCWYFARQSGRNEAWAIVWGLLCGLLAFLIYVILWAKDTGGRNRKPQGPYDTYDQGAYAGPPPYSPDPYSADAANEPYPPSPIADFPYGSDSQGLGSYCPRCGAPQEPESMFCPQCGERIPATGRVEPPASPTQPIIDAPPLYPPPTTPPGAGQPPAVDPPPQSPGPQSVPPPRPPSGPPGAQPSGSEGRSKPSQGK